MVRFTLLYSDSSSYFHSYSGSYSYSDSSSDSRPNFDSVHQRIQVVADQLARLASRQLLWCAQTDHSRPCQRIQRIQSSPVRREKDNFSYNNMGDK